MTRRGMLYAWQEEACFPGQAKMARDLGVSERHLRRFLREFEAWSYIRIKQQGLTKPRGLSRRRQLLGSLRPYPGFRNREELAQPIPVLPEDEIEPCFLDG